MKSKTLVVLIASCLTSFLSCSQGKSQEGQSEEKATVSTQETKKTEQHRYGGWYCPDNLNGFPAVDISNWENVPVVNGRMATKEETQNGTSLIFVDAEKYPHAKPLDMAMPKLAKIYNRHANREDLIIVIQAINVDNDSVVGFRYLNGGNGSAWLHEVTFLNNNEIEMIPEARFVSHNITINTTQDVIWEVLTKPEHAAALQSTYSAKHQLKSAWTNSSNVNFNYPDAGNISSSYANKLFGCFYIQNDYENSQYTEKFLLLENAETKHTELKIVCGPYDDDFETQQKVLTNWAVKVKELSEKE